MLTSLAKLFKDKNRLHNVWIEFRGSSYENFAKFNYKSYSHTLPGPDVEKCHFWATPIWIEGKIQNF